MADYNSMNVVDLLELYATQIVRLEHVDPAAKDLETLAEINRQISARLDNLLHVGSPVYLPLAEKFAGLLERGTLERMASARANQNMFA